MVPHRVHEVLPAEADRVRIDHLEVDAEVVHDLQPCRRIPRRAVDVLDAPRPTLRVGPRVLLAVEIDRAPRACFAERVTIQDPHVRPVDLHDVRDLVLEALRCSRGEEVVPLGHVSVGIDDSNALRQLRHRSLLPSATPPILRCSRTRDQGRTTGAHWLHERPPRLARINDRRGRRRLRCTRGSLRAFARSRSPKKCSSPSPRFSVSQWRYGHRGPGERARPTHRGGARPRSGSVSSSSRRPGSSMPYFSSPRSAHPTLSVIADEVMSVQPGRALFFALWVALGWVLVRGSRVAQQ